MQNVSVKLIEKAIYEMCTASNLYLPTDVYEKIKVAAEEDRQNEFILKNAFIAAQNKRPLCQDTGQVVVFLTVGQEVHFTDGNLKDSINKAVSKCYKDNYFRKSVVFDALNNRANTQDNTPAAIHYNIIAGETVEIKIMIKGGGSENVTQTKMMMPTSAKEQIFETVIQMVKQAGKNACPPVFVGIGFGQTLENAVMLSKKAVIDGKHNEELYKLLNKNIEIGLKKPVLDAKILSESTHIASMPMAVSILCHSNRYNSCVIKNNEIVYTTALAKPEDINVKFDGVKICAQDKEAVKSLLKGQKVLLSGKILTARDQAHKKIIEMLKNGQKLPINLKNSVIFYAGPCPSMPNEISGPIGPTTSKRMDAFAIDLYEQGVIATVGKGDRNERVMNYLKGSEKKYFELQGGIASYIANCVKSSEIKAFEDFGAEAVYELEVEDLPLICVE